MANVRRLVCKKPQETWDRHLCQHRFGRIVEGWIRRQTPGYLSNSTVSATHIAKSHKGGIGSDASLVEEETIVILDTKRMEHRELKELGLGRYIQ